MIASDRGVSLPPSLLYQPSSLNWEQKMVDECFLRLKKLDEIYRSPNYLGMDKLDLVSEILAPEYQDRTTKRLNNRLKSARLIGTPCDISKCVDSTARQYTPAGAPKLLSSLKLSRTA